MDEDHVQHCAVRHKRKHMYYLTSTSVAWSAPHPRVSWVGATGPSCGRVSLVPNRVPRPSLHTVSLHHRHHSFVSSTSRSLATSAARARSISPPSSDISPRSNITPSKDLSATPHRLRTPTDATEIIAMNVFDTRQRQARCRR